MQMTLADPAVDSIELVLEAWSAARPAEGAPAEQADELGTQLSLRLGGAQLPIWDERRSTSRA